jgi:hypothetical protein
MSNASGAYGDSGGCASRDQRMSSLRWRAVCRGATPAVATTGCRDRHTAPMLWAAICAAFARGRRFLRSVWLVVALIAASGNAHANPIWCTGTLSHLWVDSGGVVQVLSSWRQDHTAICSITTTWNAIPVDVCRSWYALLLTARASGQRITTMYFHNSTCSTLPTYNSTPAPSYVMLLD